MKKSIFLIGRIMVTLVAIWSAFGSYIFDWNHTHIFNPRWPPHAKFHNAQTMLLGTALGLTALGLLWLKKNLDSRRFDQASLLASFYWLTQMGATLFPGTALIDPEFAKPGQLPIQLIVDIVMLTILGIGYTIGKKQLKKNGIENGSY